MGQLDITRLPGCELCEHDGGLLVVRTHKLRVIRVLDADYPGFYRVIWNDHVAVQAALAAIGHLKPLGEALAALKWIDAYWSSGNFSRENELRTLVRDAIARAEGRRS